MVKLVTDGIFDGELENGRSLKNLGVASGSTCTVALYGSTVPSPSLKRGACRFSSVWLSHMPSSNCTPVQLEVLQPISAKQTGTVPSNNN